jgi:FtsZ-binding cell division protein ZapB
LDNLEKLENKIGQVLGKLKELEKTNKDLQSKNDELEKELKACRLQLEQFKDEKSEIESRFKEQEVTVKDKISELLGKLDDVEAEIA